MKDDLDQLLRSLHMRKIAEIFDEEVKRAEKADTSYQEFVARLMRAQWQANQEAALAWRIKRAGLPEQWTIESFPFKRQPGVNARQIRTFAELEFVTKAENIVLVGPTGVGKTGLASGLLLKALQNGHRGVFMLLLRRTRVHKLSPPYVLRHAAHCGTVHVGAIGLDDHDRLVSACAESSELADGVELPVERRAHRDDALDMRGAHSLLQRREQPRALLSGDVEHALIGRRAIRTKPG